MSLFELILIAVSLSMDAFAVSVCQGLFIPELRRRHAIITGLYFGGFQAAMPLLGYLLGSGLRSSIIHYSHWITSILLSVIGINMIREALIDEDCDHGYSMDFKNMIMLSLATSIDALAVGITFSFLHLNILPTVSLIGIITFLMSATGVKLGHTFGIRYKTKAELAGGLILLFLGAKVLLEHLLFR